MRRIRAMENLPSYADLGYGEYGDRRRSCAKAASSSRSIRSAARRPAGSTISARTAIGSRAFVKGKRVLDMFSYLGAWGLRAAAFGASEVVCVDASQTAVEAIGAQRRAQRLADRVRAVRADAFDHLKALREARERFDVVILDPPAFVKRKKDFTEGRLAYRRLNELGMQVLGARRHPGDLLVLVPHAARGVARHACSRARGISIARRSRWSQLQQAPDHPVHPAIPETDYLKGFICRVLPA